MPGGYCRNSGTRGSPDAAKVGPTSGPTRKASKTWSQDRRWATPSPPRRRWTSSAKTPGEEWMASWSNLSPGQTPDGRHSGSVTRPAAGLLPCALSVLKTIRMPMRALGARRLGLQEEGHSLGLGRWGVSPLPPPFLKVDSDNTWTCMEEKKPRLHHTPKEGFVPAKNPLRSLWLP